MRSRSYFLNSGVLILVFLLAPITQNSSATDKEAVPPTAKELVGVWIGFDGDELTFTRLDLRANGTGYCARVSPSDTILHAEGVHVYRITGWMVTGWNIEIETAPASNAVRIGYLRGRIVVASLRLLIGGPENGGWKETLLLYPESRISASDHETQNGIEEAERGK